MGAQIKYTKAGCGIKEVKGITFQPSSQTPTPQTFSCHDWGKENTSSGNPSPLLLFQTPQPQVSFLRRVIFPLRQVQKLGMWGSAPTKPWPVVLRSPEIGPIRGLGLRKFREGHEQATAHYDNAFPGRVTPTGPWQACTRVCRCRHKHTHRQLAPWPLFL